MFTRLFYLEQALCHWIEVRFSLLSKVVSSSINNEFLVKIVRLNIFSLSCETRFSNISVAGRQHRERFPKATSHRASQVLDLIHTDLVGPLKVPSLSGSRYFIVFTDDFSRKSWVYFLKTKGEAFSKFQEFKIRVENEIGRKIITLRSDQGGEFQSRDFISFCKNHGIFQQLTMARTPQQNGVAERRNRTIIERARSMASTSSCPNFLWTELINTENYLINISPTRSNHGTTPDHLYYGTVPKVAHEFSAPYTISTFQKNNDPNSNLRPEDVSFSDMTTTPKRIESMNPYIRRFTSAATLFLTKQMLVTITSNNPQVLFPTFFPFPNLNLTLNLLLTPLPLNFPSQVSPNHHLHLISHPLSPLHLYPLPFLNLQILSHLHQ